MTTPLAPQAALEQACLDAIRTSLGYTSTQSDRMFDGRPRPNAGNVFVSVWSDNGRRSQSRTCLDETFTVSVTLTVRFTQPFDRWVKHRDEMEVRANAIRALLHKDSLDFSITSAANVLAGFRSSGVPDGVKAAGWCEALAFDGMDNCREVGPDWFNADIDAPGPQVGVSQTLRFGKSRRIQALSTMS